MTTPLLQAEHLSRSFEVRGSMFQPRQTLRAVRDVDLSVQNGQVLGIVGESGCGKSTLARMLLGLLAPTGGRVLLDGKDVRTLDRRELARRVQPVFQDPYSSLNPRRSISGSIAFPLDVHGIGSPGQRRDRAIEMMEKTGLPARYADHTPNQLSGGQRQRVAIARALIMNPQIVVCDEPTSALDVSVQAQILNLLLDLQREFGLTYLFISHNLAVVEHIASQVAVMYLGRVVEQNSTAELFRQPRHPYTQALLASVLTPDPALGIPDIGLGLAFPDPLNPPSGCSFHPRCSYRMAQCDVHDLDLIAQGGGQVACHLYPSPDGMPRLTPPGTPLPQQQEAHCDSI